jgi:translation initiation factor 1A
MKKKNQSGNITRKIKLPKKDEMFAVVVEMSGGSRMRALCADNKTRMIRIGGKLKKRMWCRENDLIIVKPWVIQSDQKADLVYRYLPTERNRVLHKLPEGINIW